MSETPEPQTKYFQARTVDLPREPAREPGTVITRQEFAVLCDGSPVSALRARRDLCVGIAVSCATGAIAVAVASPFFAPITAAPGTPSVLVPNWAAWAGTFLMTVGAVAAGVLALVAQRDATRSKTGYDYCIEKIDRELRNAGS